MRNSASDDDSIIRADCIKPEECDPKYDRRPKNSSVILNPAEQNNTMLTIDSDVTTEYTTQSADNSENYSTTLSENTEDSSTIAPDNGENYSTTLSENNENSSTIPTTEETTTVSL